MCPTSPPLSVYLCRYFEFINASDLASKSFVHLAEFINPSNLLVGRVGASQFIKLKLIAGIRDVLLGSRSLLRKNNITQDKFRH